MQNTLAEFSTMYFRLSGISMATGADPIQGFIKGGAQLEIYLKIHYAHSHAELSRGRF